MSAAERRALEAELPALATAIYEIKSKQTTSYNCIAYAAGDEEAWWWPPMMFGGLPLGGSYWPRDVPPVVSRAAFELAFKRQGYRSCEDGELVEGMEKIVVYGTGDVPSHAARQLPSGRWASKCGRLEDIEHDAVEALVGPDTYGEVLFFMQRRVASRPHPRGLS